jgi:hypothetical protein
MHAHFALPELRVEACADPREPLALRAAVEQVVRLERDEAPVGLRDVDAGFLERADVEECASMNCTISNRNTLR